MTIETILGQKGTDVATIEPEASVRKAGGLVARKEYRRSRGDKRERSSWCHLRT
jgi:hypothetical protein